MNWDKKVVSFQHERGINATQLGPAEAIAANRQARIIARWQRDQLRAPEAIERAAKTIHEKARLPGSTPWGEMEDDYRTCKRKSVAAVLTALLGED